jgi:hypothetical protein
MVIDWFILSIISIGVIFIVILGSIFIYVYPKDYFNHTNHLDRLARSLQKHHK